MGAGESAEISQKIQRLWHYRICPVTVSMNTLDILLLIYINNNYRTENQLRRSRTLSAG